MSILFKKSYMEIKNQLYLENSINSYLNTLKKRQKHILGIT